MREKDQPAPRPEETEEKPLTVDEVYELIYRNEGNENRIERLRRDDELYELLAIAEELEAERTDD